MTQEQLHHITHCSPCFRMFLSIREEVRTSVAIRFRIAAAACLALMAVGTIIYLVANHAISPAQRAILAAPVTLDLRPLSAYRGKNAGRPAEPKVPLILPRKNLRLTLYFPVGADEGDYSLQLLDGELHTLLKQHLTAILQNHVVTASVDLDLRSVRPGIDTLAIQKAGDEWRTYSVLLQ